MEVLEVFQTTDFWSNLVNGWLCERAFRSRLPVREEGQVELFGETPNGLDATAIMPAADRQCQCFVMPTATIWPRKENVALISLARTTYQCSQPSAAPL